jgi:hypothetical protein
MIEMSVQMGAYDTRALPDECANHQFLKTRRPELENTLPLRENAAQKIKNYE